MTCHDWLSNCNNRQEIIESNLDYANNSLNQSSTSTFKKAYTPPNQCVIQEDQDVFLVAMLKQLQ